MEKEEKNTINEDCNCEESCECEDCNCEESCECEDCNCEESCECEDCNCEESCECEDCNCEDCNCEESCKCNENELEEKIKTLENDLLKSKAEFINYRKRLDEEHSKFLKYCNEDIIKEILPIIDNFERAITMDDDNLEDEVSKFLSGFKMIYCNLVNILKNNGVVEIDGSNKPFNPVYHEAIMTEKKEGLQKDMVIEVLQKGYILNGKVIRPAMVKVSE
jgi:molecular chaperone GrpE